jgi:hypothetical protein
MAAFVTSYIPTTTAAATRAADVAVMTGANFSNWYNQTEGSLFAEAVGVNNITASATRRFAEIHDGSISNRMIFGYNSTSGTRFLTIASGTTQADIQISSGVNAGSVVKMSATYKFNDMQQSSNGLLGTADTTATVPVVNQMVIGDSFSPSNTTINGHIRRIAYFPRRLANAELTALTS